MLVIRPGHIIHHPGETAVRGMRGVAIGYEDYR